MTQLYAPQACRSVCVSRKPSSAKAVLVNVHHQCSKSLPNPSLLTTLLILAGSDLLEADSFENSWIADSCRGRVHCQSQPSGNYASCSL